MDVTPSSSTPQDETAAHSNDQPPMGPSWEKWRNEQVQTISSLLSNVFKVEDEVRQCKAPSRLLRNPGTQSVGNEKELCAKLNAIRQQISEYEQVLQLSLKRINKALEVIQPAEPVPGAPPPVKPLSKIGKFKKWIRDCF
jgi:hypothetical protein